MEPLPKLRLRVGVHPVSDAPGNGLCIHPLGSGLLHPGIASGWTIGLGKSVCTAARVRLVDIRSVDEARFGLGTFAIVALHIFSAVRVADLLHIIMSLYEIHTKVQGSISSPSLAMTLLYSFLRPWSLYLNLCVSLLAT